MDQTRQRYCILKNVFCFYFVFAVETQQRKQIEESFEKSFFFQKIDSSSSILAEKEHQSASSVMCNNADVISQPISKSESYYVYKVTK